MWIEDLINDVDFDEMIAGSQRAKLWATSLFGALAHFCRIGAFQPPAFFCATHICFVGVALLERPARSVATYPVELFFAQTQGPFFAYPAGTVTVQGGCQVAHKIPDRIVFNLGGEQPHPAIDIVANRPG